MTLICQETWPICHCLKIIYCKSSKNHLLSLIVWYQYYFYLLYLFQLLFFWFVSIDLWNSINIRSYQTIFTERMYKRLKFECQTFILIHTIYCKKIDKLSKNFNWRIIHLLYLLWLIGGSFIWYFSSIKCSYFRLM